MIAPTKNARRKMTKRFLSRILKDNQTERLCCVYCNVPLKKCKNKKIYRNGMMVDHFIPICHGGENNSTNLFISCWSCNMEKGELNPVTDVDFWKVFIPSKIGIVIC